MAFNQRVLACFGLALSAINANAAGPPALDIQTTQTAWPPLSPGQTSFTVSPLNAKQNINRLVLPDNFTLRFDPSITLVDWAVGEIVIGKNVVFDLSRYDVPLKLAKPGTAHQADYCDPGADGSQGARGTPGGASIPLRMTVATITTTGAMWVKTDGGKGGDGQDGQDGQQGGGALQDFWVNRCENARGGGKGGAGGPGGRGGPVSVILISMAYTPAQPAVPQQFGTKCGSSTPPPNTKPKRGRHLTDVPTGVIVAFGSPGCEGNYGVTGNKGPSG